MCPGAGDPEREKQNKTKQEKLPAACLKLSF